MHVGQDLLWESPGGGKALLFEQPIVDGKKSEFPVAINTMGSRRRMAMALQVSDVEDVARDEVAVVLRELRMVDLHRALVGEVGDAAARGTQRVRRDQRGWIARSARSAERRLPDP